MGAALQRVRADIKDFEPAGMPSLVGGQPWVAMGKHLCGAATDFTLRCIARNAAAKSTGEPRRMFKDYLILRELFLGWCGSGCKGRGSPLQ